MPAQHYLPTRELDYQTPEGINAILGRAFFNFLFGDIAARLAPLEAQATDLQDLINAGTGQALEVIQENVEPALIAVNAQITLLQNTLEALQLAANEIINQGVAGNKVSLMAISGLSATNAQAAFAELHGDITALQASAISEDDVVGLIIGLV